MNLDQPLRHLPAIDKILQHDQIKALSQKLAPQLLTQCARRAVDELRDRWKTAPPSATNQDTALQNAVQLTLIESEKLLSSSLKRVINATGVILHTGLGRAALSEAAVEAISRVARGYCNLEFDLASGKRGDRHLHVETLLKELTGAEAACIVNNNAAAVLLSLNTVANRKDIIISRGQLVEIGGSFRMPEVVKKSGARLVEIGTTNKTKLADYAEAIGPRTAGFLIVHTSNYRVLGFTHEVELKEVVALARKHELVVVHDLGGGVLVDLRQWGLPYEPLASESIAAGAHVVTFSGDKVLGGPQCGLIIGEKELIRRIKKNPLMRALRCDKLTLALLENTLRLFLQPERLQERHAVFRMLTENLSSVQERAQRLLTMIRESCGDSFVLTVEPSESEAGSGALPLEKIPSYGVAVHNQSLSAEALAKSLRLHEPPIIGYLRDDRFWLDARTVSDDDLAEIVQGFEGIAHRA